MQTIAVIDNEYASMYYYPDQKIVHHVIHKPFTGQAFRDFLSQGTEVLRENHAEKWLSDDRHNSSLSDADTEWGLDEWFEQTKAAGWKYWALIVPTSPDAQMSMTHSIQDISRNGVCIMVFSDPDAAMNWLISQ